MCASYNMREDRVVEQEHLAGRLADVGVAPCPVLDVGQFGG